jgi:hypothetical protein
MDIHIPQLTCLPGSTNDFDSEDGGLVFYIDAYTAGDWSGVAGNVVNFISATPGTMAHIVAPAIPAIVVFNSYWKDINNTGQVIDATDPSNTVINCIGVNGPAEAGGTWILISGVWYSVDSMKILIGGVWQSVDSMKIIAGGSWVDAG